MTALKQAVFSFALPDADGDAPAAPEWVHLLPAGTFSGRDGRGPYTVDDAAGVIVRSMAEGEIPLDYAHALVGQLGNPAPAAGWIQAMEARDDGIWGRVAWTPRGKQAIAEREYKGISPVFFHAKDGKVDRITNAGLVNNPNLYLQAVASRDDHHRDGGADMADLKSLAKKLGLAETADAAAIEAELDRRETAHAAQLASIAEAVGKKGETKADAIAAHARTLSAGATDPDPAKYVPMSQFTEVQAGLAALQKKLADRDVEQAVNAAITAGKVTPAQKDWAVAYASQDLAGFGTYVAGAPVILKPGSAAAHAEGATPPGGDQLDDEDMAICRSMGLDPEKYRETRKKEA